MKKTTLRLRSETIRTLSGSRLGAVAGGYSLGCPATNYLCPTELLSICRCLTDDCGGGGSDGCSAGCADSVTPNLCITQ